MPNDDGTDNQAALALTPNEVVALKHHLGKAQEFVQWLVHQLASSAQISVSGQSRAALLQQISEAFGDSSPDPAAAESLQGKLDAAAVGPGDGGPIIITQALPRPPMTQTGTATG